MKTVQKIAFKSYVGHPLNSPLLDSIKTPEINPGLRARPGTTIASHDLSTWAGRLCTLLGRERKQNAQQVDAGRRANSGSRRISHTQPVSKSVMHAVIETVDPISAFNRNKYPCLKIERSRRTKERFSLTLVEVKSSDPDWAPFVVRPCRNGWNRKDS